MESRRELPFSITTVRSAKSSCDKLLDELKRKVAEENARLREAQAETASFKAALFEAYREHIAQVESIAPDIRIENNDELQANELSKQVLDRIRSDLEGMDELISGSEDPFTPVNEENDTVAESGITAEETIPESIDAPVAPDEDAFAEARESPSIVTIFFSPIMGNDISAFTRVSGV